jgi:hypothetical protein
MLYSFFWAIPLRLNFICRCFRALCSLFIGSVSRTNNRVEIVGVFIQENVWLKNSLSQSEGGGTGRGHVQAEIQAVKGRDLQWWPAVSM